MGERVIVVSPLHLSSYKLPIRGNFLCIMFIFYFTYFYPLKTKIHLVFYKKINFFETVATYIFSNY